MALRSQKDSFQIAGQLNWLMARTGYNELHMEINDF